MRDAGRRRHTLVLVILLIAGVLLSIGFRRDLRADEGEGGGAAPGDAAVLEDHECLTCHGFRDNEDDAPYVEGHGYLATKHAEGGVECSACHENHEDYPHADGAKVLTTTCGECHEEVFDTISQGVHAGLLGDEADDEDTAAGCIACHDPHTVTASCTECHEKEASAHAASIHGQALAAGDELAPHCWDCHDHHLIRAKSDPTSPTAVFNIPATCGKCHREGSPVSRTHEFAQANIFRNYSQSLHGAGLFEKGLYGHGGLHLVPHGPRHPSAHEPRVDRPRRQRGEDLSRVPRPDRDRPRQGDRGAPLGGGARQDPGLRGLPRPARTASQGGDRSRGDPCGVRREGCGLSGAVTETPSGATGR